MAEAKPPTFERGKLQLGPRRGGGVVLRTQSGSLGLSGDDLHWLVVVAGPAMIDALGGPLDARGIERVGVPPAPAKEKPDAGT